MENTASIDPRTSPLFESQKPKEKYFMAGALAFVLACALFIPYIVYDSGYFLFYGDFNVQQVPFYKLAHSAIRNGDLYWSFTTDLGANFISSYSFYLLGSPFFWLTLPFPTDFVPHLIGPLLILKFTCCSLAAYAFLTRFVKNKEVAVIGGILYAFSGFSIYNIFFNHFHEAIVYFPLLLLSIEIYMKDRRRGFFALMVGLILLCNYYFAFGMAIFAIIYVIIRMISGDWDLKLTDGAHTDTINRLLWFVVEALIGVLLSCIILLPSIIAITENNRISSFLFGWNGLVYKKPQMYWYILQSFFFPPEMPARPIFFPEADVKWSSVAGWLPLFSMSGAFAWCINKKRSWIKRIIVISAILAFVPILNQSFSAFNYSYYARWFYMPILMLTLATCLSLEDSSIDWKAGWGWTFGITVFLTAFIGLFPSGQDDDGKITSYGVFDNSTTDKAIRFWSYCAIAICALLALLVILKLRKSSMKRFIRVALVTTCAVSLLYSHYFVMTGHTIEGYGVNEHIVPDLLENADTVRLPDLDGTIKPVSEIDDVRCDVFSGMDNTAMFFGMSSIQAFQSIVPGSVMDFYPYVGEQRTVGSRPEVSNYALRGLLSVKYLFDSNQNSSDFIGSGGDPSMPGFSLVSAVDENGNMLAKQDNYTFYQNDYFVPYGFTYDKYVQSSFANDIDEEKRANLMMKAVILTSDQVKKYKDILTDLTDPLDLEKNGSLSDDSYVGDYSKEAYLADCINRAKNACTSFSTDSYGFTAVTPEYDSDQLVFFSIPYEQGWSATVDGKPVDIDKVNVGFMAIRVTGDGEKHTIRFNYKTPGLNYGVLITFSGIALFIVYILLSKSMDKRRREKRSEKEYISISSDQDRYDDGFLFDVDYKDDIVDRESPSDDTSTEADPQTPDSKEKSSDKLEDFLSGHASSPDSQIEKTDSSGLFNFISPQDLNNQE